MDIEWEEGNPCWYTTTVKGEDECDAVIEDLPNQFMGYAGYEIDEIEEGVYEITVLVQQY